MLTLDGVDPTSKRILEPLDPTSGVAEVLWSAGEPLQVCLVTEDALHRAWRLERSAAGLALEGVGSEWTPLEATSRCVRAAGDPSMAAHQDALRLLQDQGDILPSWQWSPDGERVATVTEDRTVQLRAPREGGSDAGATVPVVATLLGYEAEIATLAWTKDGTRLAVGSADGQIRVWGRDGDEVVHIDHADLSSAGPLAWSPDGTLLAALGDEGHSLAIWVVDDALLLKQADILGIPELTAEQRQLYGIADRLVPPDAPPP